MEPHGCNYSPCLQFQRSSGWLTVEKDWGLIIDVWIADGSFALGLVEKAWGTSETEPSFFFFFFLILLPQPFLSLFLSLSSILFSGAIQEAKPRVFIHFTQSEKTSG